MFGKGAPRCRRCAGAVYAAEEVIAAGQKFHTACFTCKDCRTRLSSTLLTEKEGEIYCSTCYAKNFGPKGYGIGSQSLTFTGVSVSDPAGTKASPVAAAPKQSSYSSQQASSPQPAAAAVVAPAAGAFCTSCGNRNSAESKFCGGCGKPTGATASSPVASSSPAPAVAAASYQAPVSSNFAPNKAIQRPGVMNTNTTSTKCGKCTQTVYEAEKVVGGGRVWHSACFRCTSCKSGLNSTNINDNSGNLYCNSCYGKQFGPKGFGFGGGGATTFGHTS